MKIVGIVGFAGSGKDTVATVFQNNNYEKVSFAKKLKDATAVLFGWDRELLEGVTEESRKFREIEDKFWSERLEKSFTPRLALQLMGTEVGRDIFHPDFWVSALEASLDQNKNYIISDVRFPNELRWIKKLGGKVYRVKRGPEPEYYATAQLENSAKYEASRGYVGLWEELFARKELMEHLYPKVHYSEWAWIGNEFDKEIYNDGSLVDLSLKVVQLV